MSGGIVILYLFLFFFQNFELLCPDNSRQPVDQYLNCNWGELPSHMIMTSAVRDQPVVNGYKQFLTLAVQWFGPGGKYENRFEMFASNATYDTDEFDFVFERKNQMFSDQTKRLEDIGDKTYFQWVGEYERRHSDVATVVCE